MIGVTITNQIPCYTELALESSRRFVKHTGIESIIISTPYDAFEAKLRLHERFAGKKVIFHDSDLWFIRDCRPQMISPKKGQITAVIDPGVMTQGEFWIRDCKVLHIDPRIFFNSGFFIADFGDKQIVKAWAAALQLYHDKMNGAFDYIDKKIMPPAKRCRINDFGEQSFLNAAMQRNGIEVNDPGPKWNHLHHLYRQGAIGIPAEVIAIHASAIPGPDKFKSLTLLCSALER